MAWQPRAILATLLTMATGLGCRDTAGPSLPGAPYIAIVTKFDAAQGVSVGSSYTYRVREISGTVGIDTLISVAPTDTVILSVPAATYSVTLDGMPSKCVSQYGLTQSLIVPAKSNTTIARYFVICQPLIRVIATVEGVNQDREFIYRVSGAGSERIGVLQIPDAATADTVLIEDLPPGQHDVELFNVASNCAVISPGVEHPRVLVSNDGGTDVSFRVTCSDPARRPTVLSLESTYRNGVNGIVFTAADPDGDMTEYIWDVTDCRGTSVIPNGYRYMRQLQSQRTAFQDTIVVLATFETGVLDAALQGRCASVRVLDYTGNTTSLVEAPLRPSVDPQVTVSTFQGQFDPSLTTLTVNLDISSPIRGVFGTLRMRDGSLGPPDGNQDIGTYGTVGYLNTQFPAVTVGTRYQYYDVLAVEVYVFDAKGNFTLLRDEQL